MTALYDEVTAVVFAKEASSGRILLSRCSIHEVLDLTGRKQLEIFEDQASVELAEVKGDLERAMKAQQSAALLSTAAQRNLSTFTESLKSISEDIAGGVNPRQRWTELQEAQAKRTPTAPKAKPKTVRRPSRGSQ
ncbi:unnamed protein product [Durusdinium trenchii]|uniref:Uncharacterized protein n=1 Tax=Durusdinium trenchii TaxID=1381693 RepID=A0ABP0HIY2_9DINO